MKIVDLSGSFAKKIVEMILTRTLKKKLASDSIVMKLSKFEINDYGDSSETVQVELNGILQISKEDLEILIDNM